MYCSFVFAYSDLYLFVVHALLCHAVACYFGDRVIVSIIVCIRYCTTIEHFGLCTLQSLTISLRFGLLRLNLTFVIL